MWIPSAIAYIVLLNGRVGDEFLLKFRLIIASASATLDGLKLPS